MLRCLSTDFGSRFSVLVMLLVRDIARLDASCSGWHSWCAEPGAVRKRASTLRPSQLLALRWYCASISVLTVSAESHPLCRAGATAEAVSAANAAEQRRMHSALLKVGAQFPQLRRFSLMLRAPTPAPEALTRSFAQLIGLRYLTVQCADSGGGFDAAVDALMQCVGELQKLVTLRLFVKLTDASAISFAALPALPLLSEFQLTGRGALHSVSQAQAYCLARCASLSTLACGKWSADTLAALSDRSDLDSAQPPTTAHAECAATAWAAPASAAVCALTDLDLSWSVLTPAGLRSLLRCPRLTSLQWAGWSGFAADDWQPLVSLPALRSLTLRPHLVSSPWTAAALLPSLLQCSELTALTLSAMTLSSEELHSMMRCLCSLRRLQLERMRLESLAPLSDAPVLAELALIECVSLSAGGGAPINVRAELGCMPQLTALIIHDAAPLQIKPQQMRSLNAQLLQRCPQLKHSAIRGKSSY